MRNEDIYLGQEDLESVGRDIEAYLRNGSDVKTIAESLLGTQKAEIIIAKWEGAHISELSEAEQIEVLSQYIKELQGSIKSGSGSCVSQDIKMLMQNNYYGINIDEYSDYLTELMNSDGYQRVNHHIINIMACFKPYMQEQYPEELRTISSKELEVALVKFVKEHLQVCS